MSSGPKLGGIISDLPPGSFLQVSASASRGEPLNFLHKGLIQNLAQSELRTQVIPTCSSDWARFLLNLFYGEFKVSPITVLPNFICATSTLPSEFNRIFSQIVTIIERLEQNDGGITVPDIRLFRYQLAFILSSDLDETFKYCTLHYINNLLMVFIIFQGNRVDASIRGDSEISEIMEHDLARRTYDRPKVLSPKMGLGGLKYPHFGWYLDIATRWEIWDDVVQLWRWINHPSEGVDPR
mgnify:CR=1 FL=1